MLSFVDHFNLDRSAIRKVLLSALSRGGEYSDIFCEHTVANFILMEEGIIKKSSKSVMMGAGVRTIRGEGVGYAYTEVLTPRKLKHAADTAAAIAESGNQVQPVSLSQVDYRNHYDISDTVTGSDLKAKIELIRNAEKAASTYHHSIVKSTVSMMDVVSHIQIATSEGELLRDVRPMLHFTVHVVAEKDGNRQIGISSGGGRLGSSYFSGIRSPEDHGREAARQAVLLLDARQAPAGRMELILAPAESGILLHESVGHPL
ncbi:MAG: metalloprotease TldD, partial [Candidatus Latescibacteria bacterium]|nr:metalloprotease TldD [bacterium]MBD3422842.1 metalloprotease TldD [Candidatus Latescibacterota bacterium]